jgi:hypothetical protein
MCLLETICKFVAVGAGYVYTELVDHNVPQLALFMLYARGWNLKHMKRMREENEDCAM